MRGPIAVEGSVGIPTSPADACSERNATNGPITDCSPKTRAKRHGVVEWTDNAPPPIRAEHVDGPLGRARRANETGVYFKLSRVVLDDVEGLVHIVEGLGAGLAYFERKRRCERKPSAAN